MYSTQQLTGNSGPVRLSKVLVVLMILLVAITGALACGISAGCDSCGLVIGSLWGRRLTGGITDHVGLEPNSQGDPRVQQEAVPLRP
jgi:hypothetical protein